MDPVSHSDLKGWRNAWTARSWPSDTTSVTRWLCITTQVEAGDDRIVLLRRVLGWDHSALPVWVSPSRHGRVVTTVEEHGLGSLVDLLDEPTRSALASSSREVRRVEAPVNDWYGVVSAEMWSLHIPLVVYEIWASSGAYDDAHAAWDELTESERGGSCILDGQIGYLGSTIVLVPQSRPYFVGVHDLVVPAGPSHAIGLRLLSEVFDGLVVLARNHAPLRPEPLRELKAEEKLCYLRLHYPAPGYWAMNNLDIAGAADAIAPYPEDIHGHSGSDWRVTVSGIERGCDTVAVGLIRGLGDGYFSREPWRDRAPALGFSAPARVTYVPPTTKGAGAALEQLSRAGGPAAICDPYAEPASLGKLERILRGGRLLTRPNNEGKPRLEEAWAIQHQVTVRLLPDLHDRFVIGTRLAFLVGTSLNGLGKRHSFLVALDTTMRREVAKAFDALWGAARPAWP